MDWAVSPWVTLFRRTAALPRAVRGPVDFWALARLAAIWRSDAICKLLKRKAKLASMLFEKAKPIWLGVRLKKFRRGARRIRRDTSPIFSQAWIEEEIKRFLYYF